MIRNFFSIAVFLATITVASFGQDVFGRNDIIAWASVVQEQGPERVYVAWKKTDAALAQLVTNAGQESFASCTYDDLAWARKVYVS